MVFFNCNACGEALKKNQVDKHCLRCRGCQMLSCVDCGKEFWGDDYQTHTKCMTENEKYCGKGYIAKVNKGEVKQEQWLEKVQTAIEKSASNKNLKVLLERLKDYPNIPRKKAKFENFLKNSLRVLSPNLISQVWDMLMAATNEAQDNQNKTHISTATNGKTESNGQVKDKDSISITEQMSEKADVDVAEKTSKRERKAERQKKMNKKEKKDKTDNSVEDAKEEKKKNRKRLREEEDEKDEGGGNDEIIDTEVKKKKRKKHKSKGVDDNFLKNDMNGTDTLETPHKTEAEEEEDKKDSCVEPLRKKKKVKFNWEAVVTAVLQAKGEMKLTKLRKKVLSEFAAQGGSNFNEENMASKFDKKISKLHQVKVYKDRVKLK